MRIQLKAFERVKDCGVDGVRDWFSRTPRKATCVNSLFKLGKVDFLFPYHSSLLMEPDDFRTWVPFNITSERYGAS